jgi:hypothetical protein
MRQSINKGNRIQGSLRASIAFSTWVPRLLIFPTKGLVDSLMGEGSVEASKSSLEAWEEGD